MKSAKESKPVNLKGKLYLSVALLALIIVLSLTLNKSDYAFWEKNLVYESESIYNYIQVKEDSESVSLSTNVLFGVQSIMMKNRELTGMCFDYALAGPVMAGMTKDSGAGRNILIIGLGSGTFASMCKRYFPLAQVDGVEIDGDIAALATKYFGMPDSVNVAVDDGRAWLKEAGMYDVIMIDAYRDITIPFQLASTEMFELVKSHLKTDGIMIVNINMHSDKEGSINDYISDTIKSVYPYAYSVPVINNTNLEIYASVSEAGYENLMDCLRQAQNNELNFSKEFCDIVIEVGSRITPVEGGDHIFTDDLAPVELLGMRVLDELIAEELDYYKANGFW